MEQITIAKQRASAIAKLKRATSSVRMKDGRRPPMHVEAMSKEKSQVEKVEQTMSAEHRALAIEKLKRAALTREPVPVERWERRRKAVSPTVVDDMEPSSSLPTTPVSPKSPPTTPANRNQSAEALVHRPQSAPPSHTHVNIENGVESLHNRGITTEDEDQLPERSPPSPTVLSQTPQQNRLKRLPHGSDAPSNSSTAPGIGVPFFSSLQKNILRPDAFPTNPFATPLEEKDYFEGENDAFPEPRRVPLPKNEREPNWDESSKPLFLSE